MRFAIRPLSGETWAALADLFREGGDPRWCWCQHWRLRSKDLAAAKVPELRERLREQAASDEPPRLVAFDGDRAGILPMFERAGFRVVADHASGASSRHRRVVVRRELHASRNG